MRPSGVNASAVGLVTVVTSESSKPAGTVAALETDGSANQHTHSARRASRALAYVKQPPLIPLRTSSTPFPGHATARPEASLTQLIAHVNGEVCRDSS